MEISISAAMTRRVSVTAMMPRMLTTLAAVNKLYLLMKYGELAHMMHTTMTRTRTSPCCWAR